MRAEYGKTPVRKIARAVAIFLQRRTRVDRMLPPGNIVMPRLGKPLAKAGPGVPRRFFGVLAETKSQYKISAGL